LWEAKLIYAHLFREEVDPQKYIPILFNNSQMDHIPGPLQTIYVLFR
jgi:hypothetical protein